MASVGGRVYTEPVPQDATIPFLVVGGYSEVPGAHYGGAGVSDNGLDIRGVERLSLGDAPVLALWEETEAALQDVTLSPIGFEDTVCAIRLIQQYRDPKDKSLWYFAARATALAVLSEVEVGS